MTNKRILFDDARNRVLDAIHHTDWREDSPDIHFVCDLFGRISISISERFRADKSVCMTVEHLANTLQEALGRHSGLNDGPVLWVEDELLEEFRDTRVKINSNCYWIDCLLVGEEWSTVHSERKSTGPARYVLYSIKGGVGRSTTAAVLAWYLAQRGHDVVIVDLDLESPGIGSAILDKRSHPELGIVDWFVEELVAQGHHVIEDMIASPRWAHEMQGDVKVVPAHGRNTGKYLAKLGRVYMDTQVDPWRSRVSRLLDSLEEKLKPDFVIIESRSGLHDVAATAVTDLDADVLLFAVDSQSTWIDYKLLFSHWRDHGLARHIRDRLSIVSALTPGPDNPGYLERFREHSWNLFRDELYDSILATDDESSIMSYNLDSEEAPHDPSVIFWNRGLTTDEFLRTLGQTAHGPVIQAYAHFLKWFDRRIRSSTESEDTNKADQTKIFRKALIALPEETSHGETLTPSRVYLPPSHRRALHPNTTLVTGMRGSGKTFWWTALQDSGIRSLIIQLDRRFQLDANSEVCTGFGETADPDCYPAPDELQALARGGVKPRQIWRTVHAQHLATADGPLRKFSSWSERVEFVVQNPKRIDKLLYDRDIQLDREGKFHLVLFDALDLCSNKWIDVLSFIRGLLMHTRDIRSYRRLRVKVFLRSDQVIEEEVADFPDSYKVLSSAVELSWPRRDLYGLLWHTLANGSYGDQVRSLLQRVRWSTPRRVGDEVSQIPLTPATDPDFRRNQFHVLTGPWMGASPKHGFPYTWIPNHLGDAQQEVSPRSFLAALKIAAVDTSRRYPDHHNALHFESIKRGVQKASKIRILEICEDYPWVNRLLVPLAGLVVPCEFGEIEQKWRKNDVISRLQDEVNMGHTKLPPRHLNLAESGVRRDLEELNLFRRMKDGRVDIPDVYRVGYGLGRRGGVRPVK